MTDRTYVVLLNWRGWRDTLACLESLYRSTGPRPRIVVCDNASGDGSLERIIDWAEGRLHAGMPESPRLRALLGPPPVAPVWQRVNRARAEAGDVDPRADLILVDNGANLGFAAGNNVGFRLALSQPDMDSVWLLNNDTVVEPDCLLQLRRRLAAAGGRAVCGAVIHFFDQPDVIQAIGGNRFNHYTGVAACSEGRFQHESAALDADAVASRLDYLSGCATLFPRASLEEVGLLGEDYFLYYEEIDWFTRNAGRFPMQVAGDARLYHREGSAIGSPGWQRRASATADHYLYRSRLQFMRKHFPRRVPLCRLKLLLEAARRLLSGHPDNARAAGRAALTAPAVSVLP